MQLTIGEVHTGLLMTSSPLPTDTATALLAVLPGDAARARQRPIRYAWSPDVLTGVDCLAAVSDRREARVIGTLATRLSLTGGHIVQARTHATLHPEPAGRRRAWPHYLARPAVLEVLETLETASAEGLAAGFLDSPASTATLDLHAVNVRALAELQRSPYLDHEQPLRSRRTRLRWAAQPTGSRQELVFRLRPDGLRTVSLRASEADPRALADFCADLALHDWLLSALTDLTDRVMARRRPTAELVSLLRPGIAHLVPAWMPAARLDPELSGIWQEFDKQSGFSLQWQRTVERIRDQLSVAIVEAMQPPAETR